MTIRSASSIFVLLVAGGLLLDRPTSASVAGQTIVTTSYSGQLRSANGLEQYGFNIYVEPVMFRLQTVEGKYKLLRLRVSNATSAPLVFSADRDRLELVPRKAGGSPVAALLNPQRADAPFWDALQPSTRTMLAYPVELKGTPPSASGAPPSTPESLYIYVLVPASLNELPASFLYTIASLKQTIVIRGGGATAA